MKLKKFLGTLTAVLLCTMAILPSKVSAEGEETGVYIGVDDGSSVTEVHGDIVEDMTTGLCVESYNDSSVDVTTGDITATDGDGAYLDAEYGAGITADVGDVNGYDDGIEVYTYGKGTNNSVPHVEVTAGDVTSTDYDAIHAEANEGAVVIEAGKLTAGEDGIEAMTDNGSMVKVTADEITADYDGIYVDSDCGEGSILVTVNGDVTADERGVKVMLEDDIFFAANVKGTISGENKGVDIYSAENTIAVISALEDITGGEIGAYVESDNTSMTVINAGENITGDAAGVLALGNESGNAIISAKNISSDNVGVGISMWDDSGLTVVADTISGDVVSIAVDSSDESNIENVNVIAWQIEVNENGNVAQDFVWSGDDEPVVVDTVNEEFEQNNIHYIIKLEQPNTGGGIAVTDENGDDLDKYGGLLAAGGDDTTTINGPMDMASEGQKVLLKVNLEQGYKLNGAYNGQGEKETLLIDGEGNYYIIVPKGGGVYLSVDIIPDGETYTITFTDDNGNELESGEWGAGDTPSYKGSTPTKPSDGTYEYAFAGWDPTIEPVTGNMTYKAKFNRKPIEDKDTGSSTANVVESAHKLPKTGVEAVIAPQTNNTFKSTILLAAAVMIFAATHRREDK